MASWEPDTMASWFHDRINEMAFLVAMVSQKGGVGKSTLARLLAREFAAQQWNVKICDLDISQGTSFLWRGRRLQSGIQPDVPVEQFGSVDKALKLASQYDMLIFDGAPHSTSQTREIAQASNLVVIPTGLAVDDLQPAVTLAHELVKHGVSRHKIVFALCKVGDSAPEIEDARSYLLKAGYDILPGDLPEKTAYRRASDEGRALTETRFPSLRGRAEELAQAIVDRISQTDNDASKTKKRSVA
jgi:chromosome partitioning protein